MSMPLSSLLALDDSLVECVRAGDPDAALRGAALRTVLVGGLLYGASFGLWRAPLQALYSGVKFPLLILATTASSFVINVMLTQVFGARLSARQIMTCILTGLAVMCAVLGGLSPVVAFMVLNAQPPTPDALPVYGAVLLGHVALIGAAGVGAYARMYRMLRRLIPRRGLARRVLVAWIATTGFVGCQLAWLLSPFLCKPDQPPHIVAREYFEANFYERVWDMIVTLFM